jgi:hypothetical protein
MRSKEYLSARRNTNIAAAGWAREHQGLVDRAPGFIHWLLSLEGRQCCQGIRSGVPHPSVAGLDIWFRTLTIPQLQGGITHVAQFHLGGSAAVVRD